MVLRAFIFLEILHEGACAPVLAKFENGFADNNELASAVLEFSFYYMDCRSRSMSISGDERRLNARARCCF
jgi:hypothetical protein